MKKVLFIDRDGTLIWEPPDTFQIDDFDKLKFLPGVITYLGKIVRELDYELVMVTNQDGLGTESFPEDKFWPVHNFLIETLKNEGIHFHSVHIDVSFEFENKETRKPGIAMLVDYLNGTYLLEKSFVIGDRITDVKLAENLGSGAILIVNNESPIGHEHRIHLITDSWKTIYEYLRNLDRKVEHQRSTKETNIHISLNLEGIGVSTIKTGLHFFDHMLEQISKHGEVDMKIEVDGDLQVDEHHTIEDTAIALGEAFSIALKDKRGMERYGFCLPMDDCLAQVALDFGGRSWLVWDAEFTREKIGDVPCEMFYHFFKSFSDAAKCNLNIKAEGINEHHKIEAIFKAFAKSIKMAIARNPENNQLPSTKGNL